MAFFDVFNGDADGICALHQLRLAQPRQATWVTGIKRDIALLARVTAQPGDAVTVLDVSLDRNRDALAHLLGLGVDVEYFDHHFAGEVPAHPRLRAFIDTAPRICTSAIVDRHLHGLHRPWAVVGAFGDNLSATARALGERCGMRPEVLDRLCRLGEAINYNAYGESEADLLVSPARLYETVSRYADPLDFLASEPLARELGERRERDLAMALAVEPLQVLPGGALFRLPDAAWARRVQGAYANALASARPQLAHAVLCERGDGSLTVSVRAPLDNPAGADQLCRRFPGGGGRGAAAGIDGLQPERLAEFAAAFGQAFGHGQR